MFSSFNKLFLSSSRLYDDPVKVKLVIAYCVFSAIAVSVFGLVYYFIGFQQGLLIMPIAMLALLIVPFIFRLSTNTTLVSNILLVIVCCTVFSIAIFTGNIFSHAVPWLVFITVTAVLLTNVKNAGIWLLVSITCIILLFMIEKEILSIDLNYNAKYSRIHYAIGYIGLCILVYFTSYLFQKERTKYVKAIKLKSLELENMNKVVQKANLSIKEHAEEITVINENLEETVKSRTAELEERNTLLEQYAFMNSHRLRSPICTILGLLDLLQMPENKNNEVELLEKLKESIIDLDSMTKEVEKIVKI
jgi:signal transduction histidine kinase